MPAMYISGPEVTVHLSSRHLEVVPRSEDSDEAAPRQRVPLFDIDRVVVAGRGAISIAAVHALLRKDISVTFLNRSGRLLGVLIPPVRGSSLLRVRQIDLARDPEFSLTTAEALVFAKIHNSRQVLIRLRRNRDLEDQNLQEGIARLERLRQDSGRAADLDSLRGIEGASAAAYFGALRGAFPDWAGFTSRNRRPPRDPANAVLSFTYSLLLAEIEGAVAGAGLDPCVGFLHGFGYGRPSLALDLLEPYRAAVCDLLGLHLFGHNILAKAMFEPGPEGGVFLNREGRRKLFVQYEQRMMRAFRPERKGKHTTIRKALNDNVYKLIRAMQFNDVFVPFMYEG